MPRARSLLDAIGIGGFVLSMMGLGTSWPRRASRKNGWRAASADQAATVLVFPVSVRCSVWRSFEMDAPSFTRLSAVRSAGKSP